ncbi:hypothetical protein L6R49_25085 [Myxococcota bacterium]|nr:hypothetical protein [Myxococcota bacterium]
MSTPEELLAQAPDRSTQVAARRTARAGLWDQLGRDEGKLWGCFQAEEPFWVMVDLADGAGRCGCSIPKRPCHHLIALQLLAAETPELLRPRPAPEDVAEWERRRKARQRGAEAERPVDEKARQRRIAEREKKVRAGLDALKLWLCDRARGGLVSLESGGEAELTGLAARLSDAQAAGLAGRIHRVNELVGASDDWPERALLELGRLALIVEGYGRIARLPEASQEELRALIGWTTRTADLLRDEPAVIDRWLLVGAATDTAPGGALKVRRSWLLGEETGRVALWLQFSPERHSFEPSPLQIGEGMRAALHFYPSPSPQRAAFGERLGAPEPLVRVPDGDPSIEAALERAAAAWGQQPLLERHPMHLQRVTPARVDGRWRVSDELGLGLPLTAGDHWGLLARSGGHPLRLFGEWDGEALRPLTCAVPGGPLTVVGG